MCLFFFSKKLGIQTDTIVVCNDVNLLEHHYELEGKYWKLLELGMFRQYEKWGYSRLKGGLPWWY